MQKVILILILFIISSCDKLGTSKIKTIVQLSQKLEVEAKEKIVINNDNNKQINILDTKNLKSYNLFSRGNILSKPHIHNSILYAMNSYSDLVAFDLKTNQKLWSANLMYDVYDKYSAGGILYHDSKLYITNGSKYLIIVDATNGHEIIRKPFADIIKIPPMLIDSNVILVQTISNEVFAYNYELNKILWQHSSLSEVLLVADYISPILFGNTVMISYNNGTVVFLNIQNGQELYNINLLEYNKSDLSIPNFEAVNITCTPIVNKNHLYLSTPSHLLKIDLSTGGIIWYREFSDITSMEMLGDNLFITNNAMQVATINNSTGKVTWVADIYDTKDKKPKPVLAFNPFITITNDAPQLNVVMNNGAVFTFNYENSSLSTQPIINKIDKNISYINVINDISFYIANNKLIIFKQF